MSLEDENLPMIAFFLKKSTGEVYIDFLGKVHASEDMIPITPEQAAKIDDEWLWGPDEYNEGPDELYRD